MLLHVERLLAKMDEEGLDGIVAATLPNVHYLAGFWSIALSCFPYEGQCYAVITRDEPSQPVVISSTVEIDQVLDGIADGFPIKKTVNFGTFYREGPFGSVELTSDEQFLKDISMNIEPVSRPLEGLIIAIRELGLESKKIGLDQLGLHRDVSEAIQAKFYNAEFIDVSSMLRWVRKVKTVEEEARLRKVTKITEQAILSATAIARQGTTEYELAREFERSIVSQGGRPYLTLIRIGRNAVAGQRLPDQTSLNLGDIIWFDTGVMHKGYWADIARCFSLGEPDQRAARIYKSLLQGEDIGISEARVGMTGGQLYERTMEATRAADFKNYRRHHLGHGIGSEVYEAPLLAHGNSDIIEEGMVINIETPYYEFGLGALHVEDPFIIRKDGKNELLSTLPRSLQILPI